MTEKTFVVEITPVIDTAGNTQTFLFGTQAFATGPTDTPANTPVRPYLKNPGALRRELFSGARVTGAINPSYGNIVLANVASTEDAAGDLDDWLNYGLSGSKVIVRYGTIGDAYPDNWTIVYIAYAQSFVADLNEITIRLRDRLQLFDRPIVSSGFNGSGGLEGTVSATKKKQFVAGICEFIPAILIDEQKQIYFVQSTAPYIYDLTTRFLVYDNGIPIAKQSNYTSASTLLDIAPGEGFCRFYFGNGSGYAILNGQFLPGRGFVYPADVLGTTRRWPARNGPVYFRLGSPPAGDIRVSTFGAPDDTDYAKGGAIVHIGLFSAATFATRVDIPLADIDASAQTLFISGRFVADNLTYLDVLADQCLANQGWFGFTRLDKFRAGLLKDPVDAPSTSLYEFTLANIQNLRREPINGMEAPVWKLSVTAGQTYPSQVANGASSSVKDYLTREVWNSFQGVSTEALKLNPGAIATTLDIKGRDFFSQQGILNFLNRYFLLFGGRRDFFTFTTPMTDEVLALELHDVVTLKIPRFGLSAGKKFRIVGIEIQCANSKGPTVKLTLWGGDKGVLTGYDGGPDSRPTEEQTLIDPLIFQEQMGDFESEFFGITDLPSDSFSLMDDFTSVFLCDLSIGEGCDNDFNNVVLLLHFDDYNMSTLFIDSSLYRRAITRFGNTSIKTDQSQFGGASAYFDGTGDYLSLAYNDSLSFNSVDFTIEGWARYSSSMGTYGTLIDFRGSSSSTSSWEFFIDKSNRTFVILDGPTSSNVLYTDTNSIPVADTWFHWAIVRSGSTVKIYINGVNTGANATATYNPPATAATGLRIGLNQAGSDGFLGHMDEMRITKNIARYTENFIVTNQNFESIDCDYTGCDSSFDNVVLLLHCDNDNNSASFRDSSGYNKTVTANGNVKQSNAQIKFGPTSAYFDGTDDYLSLSSSADFQIFNSNFTIETWIYYSSTSGNKCVFEIYSATNNRANVSLVDGNFVYYTEVIGVGSGILITASAPAINTWHHIALVKNGSTITLYINGIDSGSTTSTRYPTASSLDLRIGVTSATTSDFAGYLDDFRITKGIARYTENFSAPDKAFPNSSCAGFNRTMLLLHGEGLNNATTFTDSSSYNRTATVSGTPKISTAQSKFGSSSIAFDGTSGYIDYPRSNDFYVGSQDFTIEFWTYLNSNTGNYTFCRYGRDIETTGQTYVIYGGNGSINARLYTSLGTAFALDTITGLLTINTWHHIALVGKSQLVKLYLNGVVRDSELITSALVNRGDNPANNTVFRLGPWGGAGNLNGYIDELRFVKGFAMYDSNFTPPTAPFADE